MEIIDIIILAVAGIALIMGFVKGFAAQLFSLAALIGAGIVANMFAPTVSGWLEPMLTDKAIRDLVSLIAVYVIVLIVLSLILGAIKNLLRKIKIIKTVDILLGGLVSLAIVYAVVGAVYAIIYMPLEEDSILNMVMPAVQKLLDKSMLLPVIYKNNHIGELVLPFILGAGV